jgi:hypothetical protein
MVLTVAAQAFAVDCRTKIPLTATADGVAIDASGTAEAREVGAQKRFKVSMDARVADGTTFAVRVNDNLVGTITIVLGEGELGLNNNNDNVLPDGFNLFCTIGLVEVKDGAGTVVLQGTL